MPGDEDAVAGQHQIGFDIVGALVDGAFIGGERMFGPFAAGPAMGDDEGFRPGLRHRWRRRQKGEERSEEHTSELQSLMRISYAVFCLKKKKQAKKQETNKHNKRSH